DALPIFSEALTPPMHQWVFGTSVTITRILFFGASKVSLTVSVTFFINASIFSCGLPSKTCILISGKCLSSISKPIQLQKMIHLRVRRILRLQNRQEKDGQLKSPHQLK